MHQQHHIWLWKFSKLFTRETVELDAIKMKFTLLKILQGNKRLLLSSDYNLDFNMPNLNRTMTADMVAFLHFSSSQTLWLEENRNCSGNTLTI